VSVLLKRSLLATVVAAAALGLAACGSGGSKGTASTGSSTTTTSSTSEASSSATESATSSTSAASEGTGGSSGGVAKPGTTVALGESELVAFSPLDETPSPGPLEVSVKSIKKGSPSDLKNIEIEGAAKNPTPYYVTIEVTNPNKTGLSKEEDPGVRFQAVDDREQEQESVIFIGSFHPCEDKQPPADFKDGKSYTSCLTILEPPGGSIESVRWEGAEQYYQKPVTWH
jgi:hypothetical protein